MLVCKECFRDEELCSEIQNTAKKDGACEITGIRGKVVDLAEYGEFFRAIYALYKPLAKGTPLASVIQSDWGLFKDVNVAEKIIIEIFGTNPPVVYNNYITSQLMQWEGLKTEVREKSRFFTDPDFLDNFDFKTVTLKKGSRLYRARITPKGVKQLPKKKMGCPESGKATSGRANPLGIPYLYLCEDKETTYYEVRSVYLDKLSIGRFRVEDDLNIVDFHYDLSLFSAYTDGDDSLEVIAAPKIVINAISKDLSKPLRRYDTELEYVPTQYLCEYCKTSLNADGICFESSLHKGHFNYVLFDQKDATCTSVISHEITGVSMK